MTLGRYNLPGTSFNLAALEMFIAALLLFSPQTKLYTLNDLSFLRKATVRSSSQVGRSVGNKIAPSGDSLEK